MIDMTISQQRLRAKSEHANKIQHVIHYLLAISDYRSVSNVHTYLNVITGNIYWRHYNKLFGTQTKMNVSFDRGYSLNNTYLRVNLKQGGFKDYWVH